jgi:hypothetical protein
VRHNQHCHPIAGKIAHNRKHFSDELGIQCRGDFVKEHDLRPHGEGSGNCNALLLTPRQFRRVSVLFRREPDAGEELTSAQHGRFAILSTHLYWRFDNVTECRHVWKKIEVLKHHPDPCTKRIELVFRLAHAKTGFRVNFITDPVAADSDRAFLKRFEEIDAIQQCTFARSGWANHDDDLTRFDIEIYPTKDPLRPEPFDQTAYLDFGSRFSDMHFYTSRVSRHPVAPLEVVVECQQGQCEG